MKIAFLSVFYPYRGGIAQFNGTLYRAFEQEHEIKAFTFTRQYPDFLFPGKTQYVEPGDSADKIPALRCLDSINPLSYKRTANAIEEYSPDLLLLDFWMPFFAPSLGYPARRLKKKGAAVISILSNIIPHEPKPGDKLLTKWFLNQCHGFVVLANAMKQELLSLHPNAKLICRHHPNYEHFGAKIPRSEARRLLGVPDNKKAVLFFGLIRRYKGLDLLIDAMAKLPEDYFLIIAGEVYGGDDSYSRMIREKGIGGRTLFVNKYLLDSELAPYFSAADVCALPYRTATQSGIVGVAYNFGLPVISTDVGGLKEVIEPYGNGLVITEAGTQPLKDAIQKYFDENLQAEFSKNIANSRKYFSWDNLARSIAELAEEIRSSIKL